MLWTAMGSKGLSQPLKGEPKTCIPDRQLKIALQKIDSFEVAKKEIAEMDSAILWYMQAKRDLELTVNRQDIHITTLRNGEKLYQSEINNLLEQKKNLEGETRNLVKANRKQRAKTFLGTGAGIGLGLLLKALIFR
jgi:hypothetical protein